MKDGKIYQGHIMGETSRSVLISNPPLDPKPRFIELKDVMTIIRESRPPEERSPEAGRFASVEMLLTGHIFTSSAFAFSPAPGLHAGGAFRVHPLLEVGGGLAFIPNLSGEVTVTDGQTTRGYERFYAYQGGFSVKIFPFFKFRSWRVEPYLTTGYQWNRLTPKDSGDYFSGKTLLGGAGLSIPWRKPWYLELRLLYQHTDHDTVKFLTGQGDLSGVRSDAFTVSTGLSYRFL